MKTSRKSQLKSPLRRRTRRCSVPQLEAVESRLLLANTGFLQGTVFLDANADGQLDTTDPVQAGAVVSLYDLADTSHAHVLATQTTGATGTYLFTGLAPGNYQLVETPPSGYVNSATQALSPLEPILAGGTSSTINVQVFDPSNLTVNLNFNDAQALGVHSISYTYSADGGHTFVNDRTSYGQLPLTVTGTNPALTTPKFRSYCVDLINGLNFGLNTFDTQGEPIPPALNTGGNAGKIAYLYNHYGQSAILTDAQAHGLQLAMWKLEYDTGTDFTTGNFKNIAPIAGTTQAQVDADVAAAAAFIAEAASKSETAIYLDAAARNSSGSGYQGVIAYGSLDFGNVLPVKIGDFVWNDANANGIQDTGEAGINGVTLTLTGTSSIGGGSVTDHTTTAGNGAYLFTEAPGTYTVTVDASNFTGSGALAAYTPTPTLVGSDRTIDSNVNPSGTSPSTLAGGGSDLTVDFGYYQKVTIGDFVWNDTNANGIQDSGEAGINGVTLTLTGTNGSGGSVTDHATTAGNGAYLFTEAPGTYTVTVDASNFTGSGALAAYTASPTLVGSDRTIDSNVNPSGTSPAALAGGTSDLTVDFGYYQKVTIGDFVWNDTNANGIQDSGEAGINGVTLTLTGTNGSGGSVTDHATTAGNGAYLFTEAPGTYTVTVDASNFTGSGALAAYTASPTLVGSNRAIDSNPNPSGTSPSTLAGGGSDLTVDFGYYQKVTIGDFVWNDTNANGIQDSGEAGINGVTLTLSGTNGSGGSVTDHTTTAGNGAYLFTEAPGTYTVTVDASNFTGSGALAAYTPTPTLVGGDRTIDSNVNPSGTSPAALAGGTSDLTVDFGYYKQVTIGDFVWNDTNANGIQDSGEAGINGVTLTLSGTNGSGGSVTDHTTTAGNGAYLFTEAPGTYTVTVDASNFTGSGALAAYTASPTLVGSDRTIDSNVNPSGTSPAALAGGTSDLTVDFGYYQKVTIGDFVWNDTNANGIQDSGEAGINGVTLTLTGTNGSGGSVTDHATTAGNGAYLFTEAPGTYTVTVDASNFSGSGALAAYTPTPTLVGSDRTIDSNVNPSGTSPAALAGGTSDLTVDFGYYQKVTIGDFVWNDTNANGIQDSGEAGINGVTLTLSGTNGSGGSVTDHTTTAGNGAYLFTEAPGTYTVTVDASNFTGSGALAAYTASPTLVGSDRTIDSNVNPSGTSPAALAGGTSDLTVDFGYYQKVTIGDFVWNDTNANGIQDSGEAGINGVTLTLTGTNGSGSAVTDHATTAGNGAYLFTEAPGTYTVTVDASNFTGSGALAAYTASPTLVGSDRTIDSNVNPSGTSPAALAGGTSDLTVDFGYYQKVTIGDFVWNDTNANGIQDSGEAGINGVTLTLTGTNGSGGSVTDHATTAGNGAYLFTEAPGTYTVTVDASNFTGSGALAAYTPTPTLVGSDRTIDSNPNPSGTSPSTLAGGGSDLTVDFGYYQKVTIGDFVWNDTNANGIQDSGEAGINGVTLTLTGTNGSGGSVTDHTTTAGNGAYLFTEAPGTYTVTVDASNFTGSGALAAYTPTPTLVGSNRAIDSNPNHSGTSPSTLAGGGSDLTVDFGYYQKVTIGDFVWNDTNANGIQDSGEAGINGVALTLTGTNGSGGSVTDHATTAGNGAYHFTEAPGTYTVTVDASNFTGSGALAAYTASPTLVGSDRTIDSNPNPSGTSPSTLAGGGSDLTVDFGYYQKVTIGDFVWNDTNANGIQDSGEAGINGVALTLTGTNGSGGAVTDHTTTAGNGAYLFTEAPGTYTVTVDASNFTGSGALAAYTASPTLVGSNRAIDSNPNPSGTSPSILAGGGSDLTVDFGYYKTVGSISGTKFQDQTGNGFSADDKAQSGVTIDLLNASNQVIKTATTGSNGGYSFTGLAAGTYSVAEVVPTGYIQTGPTTNNANVHMTNGAGVYTFTLGAGQSQGNVNFDDFALDCNLSTITHVSYKVTDDGCTTTVTSLGGHTEQGDTVAVTFTYTGTMSDELTLVSYTAPAASFDANTASQQVIYAQAVQPVSGPGTFTITVAIPNCYYQIDFVCGPGIDHFGPAGSNVFYHAQGRFIDGDNGGTQACAGATISGTKFVDLTGNGFSADDKPLSGSQVTIDIYRDVLGTGVIDTTKDPLTKVQTDPATGKYSLGGLVPGQYLVAEEVPSGWVQTGPVLGNLTVVNVASGGTASGVNFDDFKVDNCKVSNVSYVDTSSCGSTKNLTSLDGNVHQGDTIKATVTNPTSMPETITLVSYVAPNGTFDNANLMGQTIYQQSTVTIPAGGTATLKVQIPNGYFQIDLVCGRAIDHFGPAGSNIFYHAQNRFIDGANGGTQTCPRNTLAGEVYYDINGNGKLDGGEGGLGGVTVTLYNGGGTVVGSTKTDCYGNYKFTGLAPGTYSVVETVPGGYAGTGSDVGTVGGSTDGTSVSSTKLGSIALTSGQAGVHYDFGLQTCNHQLLAPGTAGEGGTGAAAITAAELAPLVQEAAGEWAAAGYDVSTAAGVRFQLTSLPEGSLGLYTPGLIRIDATADGVGWFLGTTEATASAFALSGSPDELTAAAGSPAHNHVDLLSVLAHEIGHVLGYDDTSAGTGGLMDIDLGAGMRRLVPPNPAAITGHAGGPAVMVTATTVPVVRFAPASAPVVTPAAPVVHGSHSKPSAIGLAQGHVAPASTPVNPLAFDVIIADADGAASLSTGGLVGQARKLRPNANS